ncbi:MAG: NADPH-dependent 7-cyano-7-deazaguanine reductase QueF [Proteobacteria bacterium]|nr:MAG: NADPH-dependent 7-cyano-7-deazaguanine reductase QueF [Pseudomonadota bacterium]
MTTSLKHGELPLGKQSEYVSRYDKSILFPIPRENNRRSIGISNSGLPFYGVDIWNAYELSWIDEKGKPRVALAEFYFPADSPCIIESKSFKLYLNSFNQTRFATAEAVSARLRQDLSEKSGGQVDVVLKAASLVEDNGLATAENWLETGSFTLIDDLPVTVDCYKRNPQLLNGEPPEKEKEGPVKFACVSHLLKSNCPVTGQPDWATVFIWGEGMPPDEKALLAYIISFREQQDFHEHCVETMFVDIMNAANLDKLSVYARYTRRGGLDINPLRSTESLPGNTRQFNVKLSRQ